MLLILEEEHKEHLSFLADTDLNVVREFCKISVGFIKHGLKSKVYQSAAQKLGVSAEQVHNVVEGLMYLLAESSKLMLNDLDFNTSILALGFSEELQTELLSIYLESRHEIREILSEMAMDIPHYHNLEWRLDVRLASRSLRHQVQPTMTLKLHLMDSGKEEIKALQIHPGNLCHLTNVLDSALQEMKSAHCRRIVRNIK